MSVCWDRNYLPGVYRQLQPLPFKTLKLQKGSTYEIFMLTFPYSESFLGSAISSATLCIVPCSPAACLPPSPINSPGLGAPLVSFPETLTRWDASYILPGLLPTCAVCNLSAFLGLCDSLLLPSTSLTPTPDVVSCSTVAVRKIPALSSLQDALYSKAGGETEILKVYRERKFQDTPLRLFCSLSLASVLKLMVYF